VDVHLGMASFLVEGVLHSVGKRRPAGAGRWGTTRHFFGKISILYSSTKSWATKALYHEKT
jgi:hypothetical protein